MKQRMESELMESSITEPRDFAPDLPLTEPHFDEEATLLSAQPVVPLQEIKAEERSGKRVLFGAAILCALMLGAVGTMLIYKRQAQATAVVSTAVPGSGVIGVGRVPAPAPQIIGGVGTETTPDSATVNNKAIANPESDKLAIKESKWEQKEQRRTERLEKQPRKNNSEHEVKKDSGRKHKDSDELLRIRDIFEGPTRP